MKPAFFIVLMLPVIFAQTVSADAVIFPFSLVGVDSANQSTINQLFVEDYVSFSKDARMAPDSLKCGNRECALAAAKSLSAGEFVFGTVRKLGDKWIISAFRIRTNDGKILGSVRLDSKSLEDFEYVMKRAAEALAKEKTLEEVASIDNVTETEMSEDQYRRREGFYAFGMKFGYLFPTGKTAYQKIDYSYGTYPNYYSILDTNQYKQILMTDWVNWFELPKDLALEWDLHVGWGAELGTHFSLLKLFSRSDFAPYAGGGIGLDYVFPEDYENNPDKRNSGFALNAKAGMLLFRTYSFRLMVDAGYKIVFNDDVDQGVTANLGIMWKKRSSGNAGGGSGNPLITGLAIVGGVVVTVFVIALISN